MFDSNQFFGGERGFYPLQIEQSLRFDDDSSSYLSRTPASAGNQKTWTWSGWVKRADINTESYLFSAGTSSTELFYIQMRSDSNSNVFGVVWRDGSATTRTLVTNASYRDPSAWYHVVFSVDTANATTAHKMRLYINGVEITDFSADSRSTLSASSSLPVNSADLHTLGRYAFAASGYLDGYLAEVHFCDGTAYDADAFGEFKSGVWVAKSPSVTYGTNGFYLDFANSADIGNDVSGEGNDWTPNNFTASDVVLDSPTDNYATLNPLDKAPDITTSDGNLSCTRSSATYDSIRSTIFVSTGKWYAEFTSSGQENQSVGVAGVSFNVDNYVGIGDSVGYFGNDNIIQNGSVLTDAATWGSGDTIGVALNMDDGEVSFYKNNTFLYTASITGDSYAFAINPRALTLTANFGQLGFTYTPPTGYLALSTANLPEPTISPADDASPSDYFNTVLYTGDGSSTRQIDVGFAPDWVWAKVRSAAGSHRSYDIIRGANNILLQNTTDAEQVFSDELTAFNSTGWVTGNASLNVSASTYVAWNWKANGSGVSNTDGTITSTVSANTTSGFSIVSYTGNGTAGATVGHGLGLTPAWVIVKNRSLAGEQWPTWNKNLTSNDYIILLNNTLGEVVTTAAFNSTAPSSSVITLGTEAATNRSGDSFISYVFAEVEGFSKFGSYVGNGSTDGPFVYTGFRPAFVMVKRTDAATGWHTLDSTRSSENVIDDFLQPNNSNAEVTSSGVNTDFLSNGFKSRASSTGLNASGATYIYMAFADDGGPFKYSLSR